MVKAGGSAGPAEAARARRRISIEAAADEAAAKRHAKHGASPQPAVQAADPGPPEDAAAGANLHHVQDDVQHSGTEDNMEGDEEPLHSLGGAGARDGAEAGPLRNHGDGQEWVPAALAPAETLEEVGDDAGLQAAKAGGFGVRVRVEVAQRLAEQLPRGVPARSELYLQEACSLATLSRTVHRLLRRAVEPHQLRLSFLGTRQHLPPAPPEPSGDGDEGSQSLEELARAAGVQVDVGAPLYLVLDLQGEDADEVTVTVDPNLHSHLEQEYSDGLGHEQQQEDWEDKAGLGIEEQGAAAAAQDLAEQGGPAPGPDATSPSPGSRRDPRPAARAAREAAAGQPPQRAASRGPAGAAAAGPSTAAVAAGAAAPPRAQSHAAAEEEEAGEGQEEEEEVVPPRAFGGDGDVGGGGGYVPRLLADDEPLPPMRTEMDSADDALMEAARAAGNEIDVKVQLAKRLAEQMPMGMTSFGLRLPRLSSVALVKRLICRMHDRTIYPSYQRLTVGGKVLLDGYEQEGRDGPEWVERTLRSYGVDNGSVLELDFQRGDPEEPYRVPRQRRGARLKGGAARAQQQEREREGPANVPPPQLPQRQEQQGRDPLLHKQPAAQRVESQRGAQQVRQQQPQPQPQQQQQPQQREPPRPRQPAAQGGPPAPAPSTGAAGAAAAQPAAAPQAVGRPRRAAAAVAASPTRGKKRWTYTECIALLDGMLVYGKAWKKILKHDDFKGDLRDRGNVDLKDKWFNLTKRYPEHPPHMDMTTEETAEINRRVEEIVEAGVAQPDSRR